MSNCMTIADETIDQRDTCTDITPKDVVDFVLEEALLSAFVVSEKGCSRIGDFNITDDFRQQDPLPHPKDFEQVDHSQSTETQESNLNSGESVDRSARENLELLIDSFVKKEEKPKPAGEYTVITEDVLANNELLIQNGKIHLEKSKADEEGSVRRTYFGIADVVKDEKIEIEYFNEGKLNKIYVPLNPSDGADAKCVSGLEQKHEKVEGQNKAEETPIHPDMESSEEDNGRPFKPFTTEVLRQSTLQVWEKESSSLVGKWDGDVLVQGDEAVRLMEELSSVHVFPDNSADPNRPRACAFAEEDVKKMIREIEEISFTQCHANSEDFDVTYHPDGQGDADLESKSFTKSKDNIAKPQIRLNPGEEFFPPEKSSDEIEGIISKEGIIPRERQTILSENTFFPIPGSTMASSPESADHEDSSLLPQIDRQLNQQCETPAENYQMNLSFYSDATTRMRDSLEGMLDPSISQHERLRGVDDNQSCSSLLMSRKEHKTSEVFLTDSQNLKEFQNEMSGYDEFFPETMSLSGNIGSLSGSKLDEFTLRNMEFTSELDIRAFQGKRSDLTRGSRSVNITQENALELNNQGTVSLGRLAAASTETYKRLDPDSVSTEKNLNLVSMETSVFVKKSEEMRKSQDAGNFLQGSELSVQMSKSEEDSNLIRDGISEKLDEATKFPESQAEKLESKDVEAVKSKVRKTEGEEQPLLMEDTNIVLGQNLANPYCSSKRLNKAKSSSISKALVSSQPLSQVQLSNEPLGEDGSSEACNFETQEFKLQSQKMYLGANYEVAGQSPNEFTLTESEEAFIDMTESVIQIIDPPENNIEEENNSSSKISFSLLSEVPNLKTLSRSVDHGSQIYLDKTDSSEMEYLTKRVYSGMTTIGPIKNVEHDPKDLTAPEIDFGKMTRITSSRQLANDIGLFNPDIGTIKILEENDSDENSSLNIEMDLLEHTSLVNRDIASLTKVQKIREVMSYQPKSEEDFEDDEVLARPRLDLKDVESMTDERYKVPDVSIPLLSFEIGESELTTEKELMESMSLVISGLANPEYYDGEIEDDNVIIQGNTCEPDTEHNQPGDEIVNKKSSKTKETEGEMTITSWEKERKSILEVGKESEKEIGGTQSIYNGSQLEGVFSHQKYGTLGSVFKKASNRLMRKEGDQFVRNSKSLPRDASRTSATDSIRSMLDDCQSSASNILKKSRSLLKNTQSVFKSISQGKVSPDSGAGRSADQKKPFSPSQPDVTVMEKKFSGFPKKEDFTKAKNLIKGKVEKALKSFDTGNSAGSEPEMSSEKRDLRVAIINKENLQVDRMENFKKLLPKTPLVYKSQFVKSQMNVQNNPQESMTAPTNVAEVEDHKNSEVALNDSVFADNSDKIPGEETENSEIQEQADFNKQIHFPKEKLQWIRSQEYVETVTNEDAEPNQSNFIIMQTVQGLPAGSDLESPSSEKENVNVENIGKIETEEDGKRADLKKTSEASNSMPMVSDDGHDVVPSFPDIDDEKKVTNSPSERKIKTKKKKLTARFRSFWCSAFGRVKTPTAKTDLSQA